MTNQIISFKSAVQTVTTFYLQNMFSVIILIITEILNFLAVFLTPYRYKFFFFFEDICVSVPHVSDANMCSNSVKIG